MAGVRGFGYFVSRQRCIETWPPGVRFKFRIGAEELIAARGTEINSFFVIAPIRDSCMAPLFSLRAGLEIGLEPGSFAIGHHSMSPFASSEWTRSGAEFERPAHLPPDRGGQAK